MQGRVPFLGQEIGEPTHSKWSSLPAPSWPGLFLESARWLIVKRQIEEAQSVLRILAERNRPHGQMLGEEAQEALQGKFVGGDSWGSPCRSCFMHT